MVLYLYSYGLPLHKIATIILLQLLLLLVLVEVLVVLLLATTTTLKYNIHRSPIISCRGTRTNGTWIHRLGGVWLWSVIILRTVVVVGEVFNCSNGVSQNGARYKDKEYKQDEVNELLLKLYDA
jgi:hypothetical protein